MRGRNSSAGAEPGLREKDKLAPDPAVLAKSVNSWRSGGRASRLIKVLLPTFL